MSEPENAPEAMDAEDAARSSSVLSLTIRDKGSLHTSYMPFVKGGGLFIPTSRQYQIDQPEKLPVAGIVCWVTPDGAQGGRKAGVGVRFAEKDATTARNKIESLLGGKLKSDRPTHTM